MHEISEDKIKSIQNKIKDCTGIKCKQREKIKNFPETEILQIAHQSMELNKGEIQS